MDGSKKLSRRAFLAKAGGSVVSISLPGIFVKLIAREKNDPLIFEATPGSFTSGTTHSCRLE